MFLFCLYASFFFFIFFFGWFLFFFFFRVFFPPPPPPYGHHQNHNDSQFRHQLLFSLLSQSLPSYSTNRTLNPFANPIMGTICSFFNDFGPGNVLKMVKWPPLSDLSTYFNVLILCSLPPLIVQTMNLYKMNFIYLS